MSEKNIILHWSRGYHEIFQNSIILAYVPKKKHLDSPVANMHFILVCSKKPSQHPAQKNSSIKWILKENKQSSSGVDKCNSFTTFNK